MKQQWNTAFRWSLGALAVMGASLALAQAQPAPEPPPPAAAHAQPHHPAKQMHKHVPKHGTKHKGSNKYASPKKHEAAAVAAERRRGAGHGESMDQYQRNALKRCDVFKTEEDRRSCVARVHHAQVTGSVEGGGVLRKYTETAPAAGHHHAPGHAPAHAPHKAHHPEKPAR